MAKTKLNLISPIEFSAKSLHQKNDYLQALANQVANARGIQDPEPLDKDSLSSLRRFYMRRKASDLHHNKRKDPELQAAMQRLADAIHLGEVSNLIHHEANAPIAAFALHDQDAQLSFFTSEIHDAPLKDDVNLMDVAPFSMSKIIRSDKIIYKLPDCVITIQGTDVGIITAYDYDIFILMVSQLSGQMRQYRTDIKKGLRPSLPPRIFRPSAIDILRFCKRTPGGKQYADLEKALDRLQTTQFKITNLTPTEKRREAEGFTLIGRYKVISHTTTNRVDEIEIEIPEWVYQGVVTAPGGTPSILTLNPDYFSITRPMAKFIYRLARKACGMSGFAEYGLKTLYQRSGSATPYRKFRAMLQTLVETSKTDPLPDFDISIVAGRGGEKLRMVDRTKALDMKSAA